MAQNNKGKDRISNHIDNVWEVVMSDAPTQEKNKLIAELIEQDKLVLVPIKYEDPSKYFAEKAAQVAAIIEEADKLPKVVIQFAGKGSDDDHRDL